MDELPVSQIDAAVRGARFIGGKENQIPRNQLAVAGGTPAELVLFIGRAGNGNSILGEDILQVARAVKGLGGIPAKFVRDAEVGFGCADDGVYLALSEDWLIIWCQLAASGIGNWQRLWLGDIAAPVPLLGFLQGPPSGVIDDSGDADLLVALKFGHSSFGLIAVDTIYRVDGVADIFEFFLQ